MQKKPILLAKIIIIIIIIILLLLRCVYSAARERLGAHGGGEGRGISCRHAHSLLYSKIFYIIHCILK